MDRTLIEQYARERAEQAGQAIKGLAPEDLLALSVPGTWSIQQIVPHLMDSDLIGSDRMKRVIAEDNPTIVGYDEAAFSQKLCYDRQDALVAAEIFRQNRLLTATLLRQQPDPPLPASARTTSAARSRLATWWPPMSPIWTTTWASCATASIAGQASVIEEPCADAVVALFWGFGHRFPGCREDFAGVFIGESLQCVLVTQPGGAFMFVGKGDGLLACAPESRSRSW